MYFALACLGLPCRECPHGYYGEQCIKTCSCGTELCDDVLGCVTTGKTMAWNIFDMINLSDCIEINIFQLVKQFDSHCFYVFLIYGRLPEVSCFVFSYQIFRFFSLISICTVNIIQIVLILANILLYHFSERQFGCFFISAFRFTELYQHRTGFIALRLA